MSDKLNTQKTTAESVNTTPANSFSATDKEKLIEQIQYLHETDIGDFKRKTALYLNRFAQEQNDKERKNKIHSLKNTTLYAEVRSTNQRENIDRLRFAIVESLKKL